MKISYQFGKTWFHHLDPITKSIWCLIINIWLICLRDPLAVLSVCSIVFLISAIGAKLNLKGYGKTLIFVGIGGVGLILFQGIFQTGPSINIWFVHLSIKGLKLGLAILLRLIGIIASALAFSTTTSPKDISTAMIKIRVPYRISHMVYLSIRFVFLVVVDLESINDVQQLRGSKKGIKRTVKTLITLLITELRRADDTVIALDTRGFGLYPNRTITKPIHISKSGIILVTITLVIMVIHLIVFL